MRPDPKHLFRTDFQLLLDTCHTVIDQAQLSRILARELCAESRVICQESGHIKEIGKTLIHPDSIDRRRCNVGLDIE